MKYKVIGWTNYDNYDIPFSNKTIGFAERNAIIDEIRKHKYLFSGWHHQEAFENCVPVLNDGKKRGYSQRGWGGVMAFAYGDTSDYGYSIYTFYESIKSSALCFPKDEFDVNEFKSQVIKNEHFDVDVCEELFEIAKIRNPFYLEENDKLRFIDENDTVTLHCNEQSLTFLVHDININKKEIDFKQHDLINSKYKIIVTHKPMRKVYERKPLIILDYEKNDVFKECLKEYNFNTLLELFISYGVSDVTGGSKSKKTLNTLKKFVNEYFEYAYDSSIMVKLLYYINDFQFFKEIAYKAISFDISLLKCFVIFYFDKGENVDEDILKLIKLDNKDGYGMDKILFKAIELKPENKNLRYRYYKSNKFADSIGFILMVGGDCFNKLSKEDKLKLKLDEYDKLNIWGILNVILLLTYPNELITKESYNYPFPSFYRDDHELIRSGIKKYQDYIHSNYDVLNILEDMLLCGIDKVCKDMDRVYDGYDRASTYIYTLDQVTKFKYNLKEKAINKYPSVKEYLDKEYKS